MRSFAPILALGLSLLAAPAVATISYDVTVSDATGATVPFTAKQLPGRFQPSSSNNSSLSRRIQYSSNWCGAVQEKASSGSFASVKGGWTIPSGSIPSGGSTSTDYYLYQWIGIDGLDCDVIWQAGSGIFIEDGALVHFLWTEWYPGPVQTVSNIGFNTGDSIFMTLTATSSTTGTVVIENTTQGKTTTISVNGANEGTLCLETAEWIAEDPEELPFVDFSTFEFTDCEATTTTGATMSLSGATIWEIDQSSLLCQATELSSSSLQVQYA